MLAVCPLRKSLLQRKVQSGRSQLAPRSSEGPSELTPIVAPIPKAV